MTAPVLEAIGVGKRFPAGRGLFGPRREVHAVDDVSLAIHRGEALGLVGESGCGKTTVGRLMLRLIDADDGTVRLLGDDITALTGADLRPLRRRMQLVFQDPFSSLNPRHRVRDILAAPWRITGGRTAADIDAEVVALMQRVGLEPDARSKFPHEFSGGQRQRIGIARAIALKPEVIVCDEPVSALDVSVQAQIVNLLGDLRTELGVALLFISHDLAVVENVCDRVAVMYLGRIVECAPRDALFDAPAHPYTRALLDVAPRPDPAQRNRPRTMLSGEVPSPVDRPPGCAFHPRCPVAVARCRSERPQLRTGADGRHVACHLA